MVVRELLTKLGFQVDDKKLDKFKKGLDGAKKAAKVTAVVAVGAAGSLFALAKSAANAGDDIAKTAPTVGLTTDEYQELRHAVDLAGVSQEKFRSGMRRLSVGIGEASQGFGTAKRAFDTLGVSTKDNQGRIKSTSVIMEEVSDKFKNIKDDAIRAQLANDLFGRSGERMANFLTQGSKAIRDQRQEARDLGMVLGRDALKDSENFIDAMTRMQGIFAGLKNTLGTALLPKMTAMIEKFKEWFIANKDIVRQKLSKIINAIVTALSILVKAIGVVVDILFSVGDAVGGLENLVKIIVTIIAVIKAWVVVQWLINVALTANPIGLIIVGIGLLIGAIILLIKNFSKIKKILHREFVKPWIDAFNNIKKFAKGLKALFSGVVDSIVNAFTNMKETILEIWDSIIAKTKQFTEKIKGFFKNIANSKFIRFFTGDKAKATIQGLQPAGATAGARMGGAAQTLAQTAIRNERKSSKTINVNSQITTAVPPGTSDMQKRELAKVARKAAKAEYERNLRTLSLNNPEVE